MNALRTPVVIGLHPGAGTSTVAAALHADEGTGREQAADIVCVGARALALAMSPFTPPAPPRPVLVIAADAGPRSLAHTPHVPSHAASTGDVFAAGGCEPGPPLRARFDTVVVVPHLAYWAGVPAPSEEIAMLLGLAVECLPWPLRAYAAALREIAAAVVRSGQLSRPSPPRVMHAGHGRRAGAPGPVPAVLAGSPLFTGSPDDDALESAGLAAAGQAG